MLVHLLIMKIVVKVIIKDEVILEVAEHVPKHPKEVAGAQDQNHKSECLDGVVDQKYLSDFCVIAER